MNDQEVAALASAVMAEIARRGYGMRTIPATVVDTDPLLVHLDGESDPNNNIPATVLLGAPQPKDRGIVLFEPPRGPTFISTGGLVVPSIRITNGTLRHSTGGMAASSLSTVAPAAVVPMSGVWQASGGADPNGPSFNVFLDLDGAALSIGPSGTSVVCAAFWANQGDVISVVCGATPGAGGVNLQAAYIGTA